jgi:sodium transport system permease protein
VTPRRAAWVVFRKEMLDGLRDRRSVLSTLLLPLLWPAMIGFMLGAMADRVKEAQHVEIPVTGGERAPYLVDWLEQQPGVSVVEGPADALAAVRAGEQPVVVVIPDSFSEAFAESRPAKLQLVSDGSRDEAEWRERRIRDLLHEWSRQMGALRLVARGVSPAITRALDVEEVEVASSQARAAAVLGFLPMFVMMAAFVGGLQIAADATAGERERGSLESLLLNPVPSGAIVLGKWGAAVMFSAACMLLTLGTTAAVMTRLPLHELGLRVSLGAAEMLGIVAATLPVALLASGMQILVATFARSYKEAQMYVQFLMLLPMFPGFFSMVYPIDARPWMVPIPILGQQVLLEKVLGGELVGLASFSAAGGSALVIGLLCVAGAARLFRSERIIFGR